MNVVKLHQIPLKRCTSNGYVNNAKHAKAAKVVKLRNATLNVVKLPRITLEYCTSNGNVNDAKYAKSGKSCKTAQRYAEPR